MMAQPTPSRPFGTSMKSEVCKKTKVKQGCLGSLKGKTSKPPRFIVLIYIKPLEVSDGKALMRKEFVKVHGPSAMDISLK